MSFSKGSHHLGLKRACNVLNKEFSVGKDIVPTHLVPEMPQPVEDIY